MGKRECLNYDTYCKVLCSQMFHFFIMTCGNDHNIKVYQIGYKNKHSTCTWLKSTGKHMLKKVERMHTKNSTLGISR